MTATAKESVVRSMMLAAIWSTGMVMVAALVCVALVIILGDSEHVAAILGAGGGAVAILTAVAGVVTILVTRRPEPVTDPELAARVLALELELRGVQDG